MTINITCRALLQGAGIGAFGLVLAGNTPIAAYAQSSQRAIYHMTPPAA